MKKFKILCLSMCLTVLSTIPAYAQWEQTGTTWKYGQAGSYLSNTWAWLDGNNDGIAECYYFGADCLMLSNTITPDNYTVNIDGAWTIDGVVQTKVVANKVTDTNGADNTTSSKNKDKSRFYNADGSPNATAIADGIAAGDPAALDALYDLPNDIHGANGNAEWH